MSTPNVTLGTTPLTSLGTSPRPIPSITPPAPAPQRPAPWNGPDLPPPSNERGHSVPNQCPAPDAPRTSAGVRAAGSR